MRKILLAALPLLAAPGAWAGDSIQGVWQFEQSHLQATNRETKEPFERTTPAGNPRIYIFTKGHYSYMAISGDEPRPLRSAAGDGRMGGPKVPAEQRLKEYRPLDVETGTFSIDGDRLAMRPLIDHIPDYMLGDGKGDREAWFRFEDDKLILVRKTDEGATITDTYGRLE